MTQTAGVYAETEELAGLKEFLKKSPTAFHAADTIRRELEAAGFQELKESRRWQLEKGGAYYVVRNGSSVIAFRIGEDYRETGFLVTASHSDSPAFKIKEEAEITVRDHYMQLNTEGYGGMICSSWMDRPLSIAGRVLVRKKGEMQNSGQTEEMQSVQGGGEIYEARLIDFARDLVLIPNLAIHMNRKVNEGMALNLQTDLLPLLGGAPVKSGRFREMAAAEAGVSPEDLLGMDLYLYNRMEPSVWGADREFFSAGRLDDLECAYGTLQGLLRSRAGSGIRLYCCFDNEEVGSGTKQGARSTFLQDVLRRIVFGLGMDEEDYRCMCARSFMLSCDNAHAVHPNHPEKTDVKNCAYMNEGIVIKSHAGQKYTSDGVSVSVFRGICEKAGVPVQYFSNRSDEAGGSTLGNLAMSRVSMNCVDIGLAQLAMHSAYETAGVKDIAYLIKACRQFYDSRIVSDGNRVYVRS